MFSDLFEEFHFWFLVFVDGVEFHNGLVYIFLGYPDMCSTHKDIREIKKYSVLYYAPKKETKKRISFLDRCLSYLMKNGKFTGVKMLC